MTPGRPDTVPSAGELEPLARVLRDAGFHVETMSWAGQLGQGIVAETPHALVLCVRTDWESLLEVVEEAQATLTNLAAKHPSPLLWDLYVVVWIERAASEVQEILRETIEHDTRYARKFVLAGPSSDDSTIERALRPLLPLRVPPSVHLADPLAAVRDELLAGGADAAVVDQAMESFRKRREVEVA